ncbi:thermonuclease family protein [Microbacterium sp. B2969]|uniref:Thermonuclease family protein n=1 Tax=Microbacterium alkaliflavum TaxID=3248839 RepID=A0ABW7QBG7_9MICO
MKRTIGVVILIAAVVAGTWLVAGRLHHPAPATPDSAVPTRPDDAFAMTVVSVWDGDTLRAVPTAPNPAIAETDDVRVRLIGIDTPEISDPAECWAEQAKAHLAALAPVGATVWAAFGDDPRDRYDRLLLYLWTDDGRFINRDLVAAGDAETMTIPPNDDFAALLATSEAHARAASAGQWGACS